MSILTIKSLLCKKYKRTRHFRKRSAISVNTRSLLWRLICQRGWTQHSVGKNWNRRKKCDPGRFQSNIYEKMTSQDTLCVYFRPCQAFLLKINAILCHNVSPHTLGSASGFQNVWPRFFVHIYHRRLPQSYNFEKATCIYFKIQLKL